MGTLILVRHTAVSARYAGICYGRSDVELSAEGEFHSQRLARELATRDVSRIVHSGLLRTQHLATLLALQTGCQAETDLALRERDFGSWELLAWDEIHRQTGDDMLGMLSDPDGYRPGGGETTRELQRRVWNWFTTLRGAGTTISITHGGPIAALRGTLAGLPIEKWPNLIPRCGEQIEFDLSESRELTFPTEVLESSRKPSNRLHPAGLIQ